MLTFLDTDKKFEIKGNLLKMMTNRNNNIDNANLSDKKLKFEFAKGRYFDEKASGNKSNRDKSHTIV